MRTRRWDPFFVTELLAAVPTAGTTALPATVRDAVVARVSRRSVGARRALEAPAGVITLNGARVVGGAATVSNVSVVHLDGGAGNDELFGSPDNEQLFGGATATTCSPVWAATTPCTVARGTT